MPYTTQHRTVPIIIPVLQTIIIAQTMSTGGGTFRLLTLSRRYLLLYLGVRFATSNSVVLQEAAFIRIRHWQTA